MPGTNVFFLLVKQVSGQCLEQRESGKIVLYPLFIIIIFLVRLLYIGIIKLLIKMRTIPAKTGNRTLGTNVMKALLK
jgi:hypothetical protein